MATASDSPSAAGGGGKSYSTDPALYIYTSLTAGSSHIVTATSRLETILRANRVPFKAIDIATDEKARMLWGRRAGKDESGRVRKLPGLVQMGMVLGDLVEIEEWNEYGELKQHITIYYDEFTQPPISQAPKPPAAPAKPAIPAAVAGAAAAAAAAAASAPKPPPPPASTSSTTPKPGATVTLPIRSVAEEAAQKAKQMHLQNLREKVHGKAGTSKDDGKMAAEQPKAEPEPKKEDSTRPAAEESSEEDGDDEEGESSEEEKEPAKGKGTSTGAAAPAGLQSPRSTGWKDASGAMRTIQSPTSTSWRPTDVDAPITSFLGSPVEDASAEEIAAVERAETIKEEPEREEEEDDSDEGKKPSRAEK